jgi:hypothetical protein
MTGSRLGMVTVGAIAALAIAAPARAQETRTDRGYVNVSGWFQPTSSFSDTVRPIDFVEASVVDTGYKTRSTPGFEAGGGVRVWRNLAAGVSVSRFSKATDGAVSAQVPHPFFFNRLRNVSGDAAGLTRDETAVHVQLSWMVPLKRWQLAIGGGPSWFMVGQDLVSDVTITQAYPYDTATFAGATSAHRSGSRAGFNAGVDAVYQLRPHVGLGGGVTFSRASVPLSDTVKVDAGGAHVNAGLRFRF